MERGGLVAREGGSTHSARAQPTRWKREDREDAEGAMPADRIEVSRGKPFLSFSLSFSLLLPHDDDDDDDGSTSVLTDGARYTRSQVEALWPCGREAEGSRREAYR